MDRIRQEKSLRRKRHLRQLGLFLARILFIGALFAMLYMVKKFGPGAGEDTALSGISVSLGGGEEVTLQLQALVATTISDIAVFVADACQLVGNL